MIIFTMINPVDIYIYEDIYIYINYLYINYYFIKRHMITSDWPEHATPDTVVCHVSKTVDSSVNRDLELSV